MSVEALVSGVSNQVYWGVPAHQIDHIHEYDYGSKPDFLGVWYAKWSMAYEVQIASRRVIDKEGNIAAEVTFNLDRLLSNLEFSLSKPFTIPRPPPIGTLFAGSFHHYSHCFVDYFVLFRKDPQHFDESCPDLTIFHFFLDIACSRRSSQ